MQYLLMCCFDEQAWNAIPDEERGRVMRQYGEWVDNATASGHYVAGGKLKPSASSPTVRVENGKPVITDGPFAETRELVAGFWLWEVKDMDEAVAWVKRCPNPMPGPSEIEIRPLYEMADLHEILTPTPEVRDIHDRTRERLGDN